MSKDYRALTPKERVEAARRTKEHLGPLDAENAKKYESLTLAQVPARWVEIMNRRGGL